tara:strand:- start:2719 stop:2949 length:231 start_codon:yes stop_codon:yes gene_type:complete
MSDNPKGDLDPRPNRTLYGEPSAGLTKKPPKVSKAKRGAYNLIRGIERIRPKKKDPCAAANRRARAAESMLKAMKK